MTAREERVISTLEVMADQAEEGGDMLRALRLRRQAMLAEDGRDWLLAQECSCHWREETCDRCAALSWFDAVN